MRAVYSFDSSPAARVLREAHVRVRPNQKSKRLAGCDGFVDVRGHPRKRPWLSHNPEAAPKKSATNQPTNNLDYPKCPTMTRQAASCWGPESDMPLVWGPETANRVS
jgi:hypothetical protein